MSILKKLEIIIHEIGYDYVIEDNAILLKTPAVSLREWNEYIQFFGGVFPLTPNIAPDINRVNQYFEKRNATFKYGKWVMNNGNHLILIERIPISGFNTLNKDEAKEFIEGLITEISNENKAVLKDFLMDNINISKSNNMASNPLLEKMVGKSQSEMPQIILDNFRAAFSVYSTPEDTAIASAAILYAFDKALRGSFFMVFAYPYHDDLTPNEIDELCESIIRNEFKYIMDLLSRKGVSQRLLQDAIEQRDKIIDKNEKIGHKCSCGLLYATPPGFIIKLCVGCGRKA